MLSNISRKLSKLNEISSALLDGMDSDVLPYDFVTKTR